MSEQDQVERMAKAIHDAAPLSQVDWDDMHDPIRENFRKQARAAIAASPPATQVKCIHMTAEMAANCPTCNPLLLRGLPTTPQGAAKVLLDEWEEGEGLLGDLSCYSQGGLCMDADVDGDWVRFSDLESALRRRVSQDKLMPMKNEQEVRAAALEEAVQIYREVAGDETAAEAEIARRIEEMQTVPDVQTEAAFTPEPQ